MAERLTGLVMFDWYIFTGILVILIEEDVILIVLPHPK